MTAGAYCDGPAGGIALDGLEHAVLDGGLLAEQFLRSGRDEDAD